MQGPRANVHIPTRFNRDTGSQWISPKARRENLPDAARDLISNAPAKSASSAELRRSRVKLQSQSTCQSRYSGHAHVSSICWQKNMPDSTSACGSIGLALGTIIRWWHCQDQAAGGLHPGLLGCRLLYILNGHLQTQHQEALLSHATSKSYMQGHNLGFAGSIQ